MSVEHGRRVASGHAIHLVGALYAVAGNGLSHPLDANAYLLHGTHPVLFDCGSPYGEASVTANLARLGIAPRDVTVLATHGHYDHVGGAAWLAEHGVRTYVHEADLDAVARADDDRSAAYLYGEEFPRGVAPRPLDFDAFCLDDAEVTVVETPGHSPGSVSFLLDQGGQRVAIVGDAVWGCYDDRLASDLDAWRASLDRLVALRPDLLCTGHGSPSPAWDATEKLRDARAQFGWALNPWGQFPGQSLRYR
jgi:glyoxylase-like metal-dependent hydrolase (beta-lactamase superfamily II)